MASRPVSACRSKSQKSLSFSDGSRNQAWRPVLPAGVSLRLQLLQVARLAPRLLGDSTDLVRAWLGRQLTDEGAGLDRARRPDLYYTIFTLAGLKALEAEVPRERVERFL